MIRTLLTTTALVAVLSGGAFAQDTTTPAAPAEAPATEQPATETPDMMETPVDQDAMTPGAEAPATDTDPASMSTMGTTRTPMTMSQGYVATDGDFLASRLMGSDIYTSAGDDGEVIGNVNDLVLGSNGEIDAVIVGVGGFLGIGEKNVAVDFIELQWTTDTNGDERWVLPTTADALTNAPEFVWNDDTNTGVVAPADGTAAPADGNAMAPATDPAVAPADGAAMTPVEPTASDVDTAMTEGTDAPDAMAGTAVDRSTLTEFDESTLTAEQLLGVGVWGPENEQLGVVGDFVLGGDTTSVDAVVVDFGGFLGLGVKEIAIGFDDADFAIDDNGNYYMFINATREQLEAQPEFNRDTYAAERDSQRLVSMR